MEKVTITGVDNNQKIKAIRLIREASGKDLPAAKAVVTRANERGETTLNVKDAEAFKTKAEGIITFKDNAPEREWEVVEDKAEELFAEPEEKPEEDKAEAKTLPAKPGLTKGQLDKLDQAASLIGLDVKVSGLAHDLETAIDIATQAEQARKEGYQPEIHVEKGAQAFVQPSWAGRFVRAIKAGRTVALVGPAGNGKTTGARVLMEGQGFSVYEMDCTDFTEPEDLIGQKGLEPDGNGALKDTYRPGPVYNAFEDENGAFLANEFDALNPKASMVLQGALERRSTGRRLSAPQAPGGHITAKGTCPIVLTMNTVGSGATREYVGRNVLDIATMDRVTVIHTGYENEALMLERHGFSQETARKLEGWADKVRKEIDKKDLRVVLSMRRLLDIAETYETFGASWKVALEEEFLERLEPEDRDALKSAA